MRSPAGIAVYGTGLQPWDEYLIDIVRVQPVLGDGENPVAAWYGTKSPVLVMYGESDLAIVDDEDHHMIARIVNHARPGSARVVAFPGTNHGFTKVGDEAAYRAHRKAGTVPSPFEHFDTRVRDELLGWLRTLVKRA